jgi:oxygen-independent coproporphyrinogen-3 oxidase
VGPGAHGRREGIATFRRKKPENWLAAVERNGHGAESEVALTPAERVTEALVMGLRMREGIDLARVAALGRTTIGRVVKLEAVERLARQGLVSHSGDRLALTAAGMPLLDAVLRTVAAD